MSSGSGDSVDDDEVHQSLKPVKEAAAAVAVEIDSN